ncbi:MAG: epoxyqueuosine reductase QueH [Treponema sp.]|jgi:predicted adenine nucleotide alpha hydrolase (AANH) superfamily ATPase|nr:epoxyqueuosine reductase QueH [Treponema sp.]
MKLLLHACCAPCSVACVQSLAGEGLKPALFWYNPNIHPWTEYTIRRDCLTAFAGERGLDLEMEDEYGLRSFIRGVWPSLTDRCGFCYRLRLEKTAERASRGGFDCFSTSLLISPYQNHELVRAIGEELSDRYGVEFLYRDFRPLFREGQKEAREQGLYMQKYCGCIFSEEERYAAKH